MEEKNKTPEKPKHMPNTDRLQHALFESDNSTYKGSENSDGKNEKKEKK
ncbi:hypothetical protein VN91_1862 [Lactococcus lactis subsp. lactis]|nr:hypothetical protein VN91_1862 [Lactococcus lactis subsp. lactis]